MYWGKIIGTLVGLATLKPVLAVVGLVLGHQFDRGFASRFDAFRAQGESVGRLSDAYLQALFRSMGHVAKADGRVTEAQIRAARSIMHRLGLGPADVRRAILWFNEGKTSSYAFVQACRRLRRVDARSQDARQVFLRLLLEVALAGRRHSPNARSLVWSACREFDVGRVEFAQLEAMVRAQMGFRQSPAGDADAARVRGAYEALGVAPDASNRDIKQAYRRQMNRNHPDKLSGSDPGPAVVAEAERRTREIRKAYELLKSRRSIR